MADVPALFQVRTAVTENAMNIDELAREGITPGTVVALIETAAARCWVAEVNDTVVGFSMSKRTEREIFALFVQPGHENHGLGTKLLAAAVDWLRQFDDAPIRLSTGIDTHAHAFYVKRGWTETHRDDEDVFLELRFQRLTPG